MKERANPMLKWLDRYVGIPLLALLSLTKGRRQPRVLQSPRLIGCLKSSAIGDTVLLSAVLRDLKTRFPEAKVILFTGSSNFAAAKIFSGADEVVRLPMGRPDQAVRILRVYPLDILIDFDSWPRINAVLARFSRAKQRLGFRTPGQFRHFADHLSVAHRRDRHEIDNYRALVSELGVARFTEPDLTPFAEPLAGYENAVVFHCWPGGSRAEAKMWPNSNWVQLGQSLRARGFRILLSTGPADTTKSLALNEEAGGCFELLQVPDLGALMKVLRSVRALVSVDTGVAHLAAGLGCPTLTLYGPTSPSRWGALGARSVSLKDGQPAIVQLGFEKGPSLRPLDLTVEQVRHELERGLGITTAPSGRTDS